MGGGSYLLILFIGAVIVLTDGQLILRKSPAYLNEVYQDKQRARQAAGLVAVMFHLVMLGLVALISSIGLPDEAGPRSIIARVGVILLVTAGGHAATMAVLARMRDEQLSTQVAEAQIEATSRARARRTPPGRGRADSDIPAQNGRSPEGDRPSPR